MFSFLKKPYPYKSFTTRDILRSFLTGVFIAFFLIIFQPFHINEWQTENKLLKLIGFGIVSFVCPIIFKLVLTFTLKNKNPEETWNVWKEIILIILAVIFIAICNLIFARLIRMGNIDLPTFTNAVLVTFLIGIFPISINVAVKYNRFITLNKQDAEIMEIQVHDFQKKEEEKSPQKTVPEKIIMIAENKKDKLEILPDELLFIESADNYSNVIFFDETKNKKQLIRSSLKRIEQQINHPHILRCHRSFIVNLLHIKHIEGNAQGYRISFKSRQNTSVPVSRNYSKALFERLDSLK